MRTSGSSRAVAALIRKPFLPHEYEHRWPDLEQPMAAGGEPHGGSVRGIHEQLGNGSWLIGRVTGRAGRLMIAHVSIGVRDIDRSRAFYDAALAPLGYKCIRAARSMVGYGYGADSISLWVASAERPVPADEKSGLHFCFEAPNAPAVDAFHAAALRAGGQDRRSARRDRRAVDL